MGRVDHGNALLAQVTDDPVEAFHLMDGDRRGRLVEEQDASSQRRGLGDLHDLDQRDRQAAHLPAGIDVEFEDLEHGPRVSGHLVAVEHAGAIADLAADEDVLVDHQVGIRREFLRDDGDTEAASTLRVAVQQGVSKDLDLARLRADLAGDDLEDRGLTCPVLACKCGNPSRSHLEGSRAQHEYAAVGLLHAPHDKRWCVDHGSDRSLLHVRKVDESLHRMRHAMCGRKKSERRLALRAERDAGATTR
jgi:hypothetical protein